MIRATHAVPCSASAPRGVLLVAVALVVAAVAAGHAAAARPEKAGDWRKRFREVYRLDEGEVVKFVPAPFIPERAQYLRNFVASDPEKFDGQFTFTWDDTKQGEARLVFQSLSGGRGTITSGFADCGELTSTEVEFETEGNPRDNRRTMAGDWIFRKSASREDRIKAVENVVRAHAKVPVHAEKKTERRAVLVARGTFRHKKMKGTRDDDAVHFYTDELDAREGAGGGSGKLADFLVCFGNYTRSRVIDETKSTGVAVVWKNHNSASMHDRNRDWLDQLIRNVGDQTGLEFKFETRPVEFWLVSVGKVPGERPVNDGL